MPLNECGMKEISDILAEYKKIQEAGKRAALATVVRVEGSSYRQPGARMLISDEGNLTGAISGGCLEGDAMRKALLVIARGKPMLVTYDTTDEDDATLGIGLGCNGIIHILIEPIDEQNQENPIRLLENMISKRQKCVLATFFTLTERQELQLGTCLAYTENGIMSGTLSTLINKHEVVSALTLAISGRGSTILNETGKVPGISVLLDVIKPAVHLVIAGAGNDIIPVVKIAGVLGWQVTVLDGRPFYATCARFPDVHQVLVTDASEALSKINTDENTVFVLMTHNYNYDLALLEQLVKREIPYIGILGPKKKFSRLLEELSGISQQDDIRTDNLYSPVGLDIGAETAEEIALSLIAEIKAALSGKKGYSLRQKNEPIHKPLPETEVTDRKIRAEFQ
jgi:xanthine/CO dehydrogenase XdhC/CoxF family maturation factor